MKLEFLLLFYFYVNSAERQSYTSKGNRKKESEVAQSCRTLSDPVDCSPPGSSIHGISDHVIDHALITWISCTDHVADHTVFTCLTFTDHVADHTLLT